MKVDFLARRFAGILHKLKKSTANRGISRKSGFDLIMLFPDMINCIEREGNLTSPPLSSCQDGGAGCPLSDGSGPSWQSSYDLLQLTAVNQIMTLVTAVFHLRQTILN